MAIGLGSNTEFALVPETTYGTFDTGGTKEYYDAVSETLSFENPIITSQRLRGGRLPTASAQVKPGRIRVSGNEELEVQAQSIGWFLKYGFGAVNTTGAMAPYTHVFTLGDLLSFSAMIKRDIAVFTYLGCKVNTLSFDTTTDSMLRCTAGLLGSDVDLTETFGSSSYPSDNDIFSFAEGCLSIDGSGVDVRQVQFELNNNLIEMPRLCGPNREPLQNRASITGTISKDFEGTTEYTKFVNSTAASLDLVYTGTGPTAPTLTFHFEEVFYTGGEPNVSSSDPIQQSLPFDVRSDGTSNGGITVTLTNSTASYA